MRILIIGGNRFFGKRLAQTLSKDHDLTLLNRGNLDDGLGSNVVRLQCDRRDGRAFESIISRQVNWDVVFDNCCYQADEAIDICKIFKGKVNKYIFISSQSVYGEGSDLVEADFDPRNFEYTSMANRFEMYAEAKKQAEAVLFKEATFPIIAVRFPIVMGLDDYSERLLFHINKIKKQEPIYFPNIEAKISFIDSQDAADALAQLMDRDYQGPLNIASSSSIKLLEFVSLIEHNLGKKIVLTSKKDDSAHSPYGIQNDWVMNIKRMKELGIVTRDLSQWLPKLVEELILSSCH